MKERKQSTINKGIPWYRDISLSNSELIVGRVCLMCGDIISSPSYRKMYHEECRVKARKESQLRASHKKHPPKYKHTPKYCVDCGMLLEETKWDRPHSKRCPSCQYIRTRKNQRKYKRTDREVTVGVDCIICGEFTPSKSTSKRYCDNCQNTKKSNVSERKSQTERQQIAKEYLKNTGRIKPINKNGTYDTSSKLGKVEHIKTTKGEPNWESEFKHIKKIKKDTFSNGKYYKEYYVNEGDIIRGEIPKTETYLNTKNIQEK